MARPKQPIDLLLHKGKMNLTKAEIEERKATEVKAKTDNIEAPSYLPSELKDEFNRIAKELLDINIMSNLDCEALGRYLTAEYQFQMITAKILSKTDIDEEYMDLIRVQEKTFKMARSSANDLGLSISSRCKLVVPKKTDEKPSNKFDRFSK